jgi:hypothetical protein
MSHPFSIIINFLVIVFLFLAFLTAGWKGKLVIAAIAVLLFGLPYIVPLQDFNRLYNAVKVLVGLGCYIYIRRQGFL